ncbi:MAG: PLP-dependent aminotransferase family protein [Hyphomicrobium sp.]
MQLPIAVSEGETATLQNQVFDQVRSMIMDGRLRAGDPLPATRELSSQMGISRNTAIIAYERLIAEGYIYTKPYVGTFVAAEIPETVLSTAPTGGSRNIRANGTAVNLLDSPRSHLFHRTHALRNLNRQRLTADFWVGRPDPTSFPVKPWSQHIWRQLQSSSAALTEYNDPSGLEALRHAISDHLGPARGIAIEADKIIIVGGCQDGFNLIARLLVEPRTPVVVENPCYQGAAFVFESFGAELYPVPIDENGLDVSLLPVVSGALAYVTPSHQYPMGATLPLPRRLALLSWADKHDAYVIEDDYDSDFRFTGSPLTAVKGLDRRDRVIYMGTFSKCMGPGLRLGYVVLPGALVEPARRLKTLMNNGQGWLEQAAMAAFMLDGGYRRHLRRVRQMYLERRDALLMALTRHFGVCKVQGEEAGMHLVWRIPDDFPDAAEIEAIALQGGVGVYAMSTGAALQFGAIDHSRRYLVLGYAALTPREIEQGIARLAQILSRPAIQPAAAVNAALQRNSL